MGHGVVVMELGSRQAILGEMARQAMAMQDLAKQAMAPVATQTIMEAEVMGAAVMVEAVKVLDMEQTRAGKWQLVEERLSPRMGLLAGAEATTQTTRSCSSGLRKITLLKVWSLSTINFSSYAFSSLLNIEFCDLRMGQSSIF